MQRRACLAVAGATRRSLGFSLAATLLLLLPPAAMTSAEQSWASWLTDILPATRLADSPCVGDCDGDGTVTVDHLVLGVSVALGLASVDECEVFDANRDGEVTIDELIQGVHAALVGCPASITPTPTPSPEPSVTATPSAGPRIQITSPPHGSFINADWVDVTGRVLTEGPPGAVFINAVAVGVEADGSFTTRLPLDRNAILNPVLAELEIPATALRARDRIVVAAGDSLDDRDLVAHGMALRVADSGLDRLETTLPSLVGLDLEALLPPGTLLINNYCIVDSPFGCIQRVDVRSRSAHFESIAVDFDAVPGFLDGDIVVTGIEVSVNIRGGVIDCNATFSADRAVIQAAYDLVPSTVDAGMIDVNLIGTPDVQLTSFDERFTSGVCNSPGLGDLLGLIIRRLGPNVSNLLTDFLRDPDGAGPLDSPLAGALEAGLDDFDFAARIGDALGITLQVPFAQIAEDAAGVDFDAGSRVGAPASAALLPPRFYRIDETTPSLSGSTPAGNQPYDLGFCLSTTTLNQILKAVLDTGALSIDLTELDLGGTSVPITAGTLSLIIPEAGVLDPSLPITIRIRPTMAPILTGEPGANGELAELRIAQLELQAISAHGDATTMHLRLALDARAGFNLPFTETASGLRIVVSPLDPATLSVTVLDNQLGADEAELRANLTPLLAQASTLLSDSFGTIELPTFLGLQLRGIEAGRLGTFPCLFFRFEPAPG